MATKIKPLIALVNMSSKMSGVEFSTLYLADQIDTERYERVVVCPEEGDLTRLCREHEIPIIMIPLPKFRSTGIELGRHVLPNPFAWVANLFLLLAMVVRLVRVFKQTPVDLICTKGMFAHFYGGLAARWLGVPCVIHLQDLISNRARGMYLRVFGYFARLFARHVIADGTTIKDQIMPFMHESRLSVIYNGVDLNTFSAEVDGQPTRAEWNVQPQEILIGNVARLTTWKGQDYLVKAFGQIADAFPTARLVLVGTPMFAGDEFEQHLHSITQEFGVQDRVIFAGFRWDLPQVLAAMDVYVHASITKDTSPLSVVSAMASGKALVCTNVGGVAELFVPQTEAILVEPANVDDLARGLQTVLADADYRQSLSRAARHKAEQELSLPHFARRCETVFDSVLSG